MGNFLEADFLPGMTSGFAVNPAPSIRVTERPEASTQLHADANCSCQHR
jgi:hypothetical protein